ncbi:transferase [Armatimonadota bacterium]|nr:transferase [Armatimonadota bacterium]
MNILQIVSSSRISGAEKHVVVLTERLHKRGHNVIAICPPGDWLPDQLRAVGAQVFEYKMGFSHLLRMANHLKKFVAEHKIDIIHCHLTRATYLGCIMGVVTKRSVISSVHVQSHDFVYRYLMPNPRNHVITVSDWVKSGFVTMGLPEKQVHTIHNGTEFIRDDGSTEEILGSETVHAEFDLPPTAEIIGIFAHVNDFKGHPLLVRAMRRIVEARPNAYLLCVGPVDPTFQKKLNDIAAADGVLKHIRFTGMRNDVRRILNTTTVIALPSLYEACSMAIIEAMALGKPVVVTKAGGNLELVKDLETGLLIERDTDAIADAIVSLLSDTELRQNMGAAAHQRAVEMFSAKVMVDNIEALYQKILHPS